MIEDRAALDGFGGSSRLFPLPNLVLFPQVVQGLHVFESRYRRMMADALADDGLLSLVLLKPGWEEDYDGRPPIEPVACLGRIEWHERLPDGRYNLRLRGLSRLRIVEELPTDRPYRTARAETFADVVPEPSLAAGHRLRLAEAVMARFSQTGVAHDQIRELLEGETPLGRVCDLLSYAFPIPLPIKQALLSEPHVDVRAEMIVQVMRATTAAATRKFPPEFSAN